MDRYGLQTVGDVTTVGNADSLPLGGVGLVVGLEGTGGEPANDNYRTMLEEELTKEGVKDIKRELANPNHALVVVTALYPVGAAKGAPIDVEVSLPPHSGKATSLRGGYLRECLLSNYDYTKHLDPNFKGSNVPLQGLPCAKCEGPVLVGMGDGDEAERVKHGRIWSGGRCLRPNPLLLLLNPEFQQARIAYLAATRINEAFRNGPADSPEESTAIASNNLAIELHVPPAYKLNLPRFLRVVRLVPLQARSDQSGAKPVDGDSYRQRLAADLLDPARTVTAALRLEALGQDSVPVLKGGLKSTNPLVRFCAAESLAYLDCPAGGEELGADVAKQPMLRAFALTALASLDESVSHIQLERAADHVGRRTRRATAPSAPSAPERARPAGAGRVSERFVLAAPRGAGRSAADPRLDDAAGGDRAVRRGADAEAAVLLPGRPVRGDGRDGRRPLHGEPLPAAAAACSGSSVRSSWRTLLRTMAGMGGPYPEALELLQQAHRCDCLSCASAGRRPAAGRLRLSTWLGPARPATCSTPTARSWPPRRTSAARRRCSATSNTPIPV